MSSELSLFPIPSFRFSFPLFSFFLSVEKTEGHFGQLGDMLKVTQVPVTFILTPVPEPFLQHHATLDDQYAGKWLKFITILSQ